MAPGTRFALNVAAFGLPFAGATNKIKHVIVLMEENRSFDHMFGFMPGVNGLKGTESNPFNTSDPKSKVVTVSKDSPYIGPWDPDHSVPATTHKVYGNKNLNAGIDEITMQGFVEYESHSHSNPDSVMQMFTPEKVPIISTLANEFAVFDRFFASVPGPTWPNRLFQLMATSQGDTGTGDFNPNTTLYDGPTVFDIVEEVGLDWKFYFADVPLELAMLGKIASHPEKVHDWDKFLSDIRSGDLPAFSYVNPRWFVNVTSLKGASDQHPDHDVRQGEALFKEVYEELVISPAWNDTLFIITYDEHGGFFDHVFTPTQDIPAPDDHPSFPDAFDFKRLGVRIPTVAISPRIAKGTVVSAPPPPQSPQSSSEYDLTSIPATVRKLFGASKTLTARDAWAGTFEHIISLEEPRTDCPIHLPPAPEMDEASVLEEASHRLNDLQQDIVKAFAAAHARKTGRRDTGALPVLQGEAGSWVFDIVKDLLSKN